MKSEFFVIAIIASLILLVLNRKRVRKNLAAMQLSKNFTLSEFVKTQTGLDNIPDEKAIANIRDLVDYILQPLRDAFDTPVIITSGYRSPLVNKAVGGSPTSQHMTGQAADFYIPGITNQQIINMARKLKLPYDQIIDEQLNGKQWVHVSFARNGRREWLTARNDPNTGKVKYTLMSIS